MAEAFVYCWTDHKTNKLYVGSHKGSLDDGYVCSSKVMLEEYNKRPCDFTRQIIAEGSWDDMFKFEGVLLRTFDVKNCDDFYNMHNGSGDFRLKTHTKDAKEKQSLAKIGDKNPSKRKDVKQKISIKSKEMWDNMNDEKRKELSESRSILTRQQWENTSIDKKEEIFKKISMSVSYSTTGEKNPMYGKKQSKESLKIMSEKAKNREKKTCPVCNKTMDVSNFSRHGHGENCNRKKEI